MASRKGKNEDTIKQLIESRIKQRDNALEQKFSEMHNDIDPFIESLEKIGDREIVILSASLLDDYLEKLITASYIKDERVKSIFKDEHVLQSFYTKTNIAYFSGLIPKWLFNDLKLICEIRNRFAHRFLANLDLSDEAITARIEKCELRPKTMDGVKASRLKFTIVIIQAACTLKRIDATLTCNKPPNLMDITKLNEFDFDKMALTKDQIKEIITKSINPQS